MDRPGVQTAAAFIALMQELGEEDSIVSAMREGLTDHSSKLQRNFSQKGQVREAWGAPDVRSGSETFGAFLASANSKHQTQLFLAICAAAAFAAGVL